MMHSIRTTLALGALAVAALLSGCERPPIDSVQRGYRGTGMLEVYNPRILATQAEKNEVPPSQPPVDPSVTAPLARDVYKNVQVLGDLTVAEFTRTMVSLTQWVAPQDGCTYCHNPLNLAEDSKYTKVVGRRMIQMTQTINNNWKQHVAATGVTCYTCHRGHPVPQNVWFKAPAAKQAGAQGFIGDDAGQNIAASTVGGSSLPYDPFTPYLLDALPIRVNGPTSLPTGNRQSIKQAEHTYGLMMHMSSSLGVNCTYCHNSRSFASWEGPPQRVTAYYGIRMVRGLNNDYLVPLTSTFPPHRLGELGDVAKVNCSTCHQGAYKPLYGAAMAKNYPALTQVSTSVPSDATVSSMTGATVYFAVGSAQLPADALKGLSVLMEALKANPGTSIAVSGFHSATGGVDVNHELAKQRAFAVRDALKSAGVAEDRVVLEKPQQTEANISGEDPKARRVELIVK